MLGIEKLRVWLIPLLIVIGACIFIPTGAFDAAIEAELKYSRDALVKQKSDIESDLERKASQIAKLEAEMQRMRVSLKDTDHALGLIDTTLRTRH